MFGNTEAHSNGDIVLTASNTPIKSGLRLRKNMQKARANDTRNGERDMAESKYCRNDRRCSAKPLGPCALWESCPIFSEVSVVEKILTTRAGLQKESLQSTAKNKK